MEGGHIRRIRRTKTYYPRMHPMLLYDEQKFQERYRLTKDLVQTISDGFEASGMCSTRLDPRGGGLSIEDRVKTVINRINLLFKGKVYMIKTIKL